MGKTVEQWLSEHATNVSCSESSKYFTIKGYIVRYSDHHSRSVCNINIVRTDKNEYICIGSPHNLMKVLNKPADVKKFIEAYLFALECNSIKKRAKPPKEKERTPKKNVEQKHMKLATEYVALFMSDKYKEPTGCCFGLKDMVSPCFSTKWKSKIANIYGHPKYTNHRFLLYDVTQRMRLLCEPAKQLIWDAFIKKISSTN